MRETQRVNKTTISRLCLAGDLLTYKDWAQLKFTLRRYSK